MKLIVSVLLGLVVLVQYSQGTAVYTRWGRSGCPPGSKTLYSGYAAGNRWDNEGGGSNYLCLHNQPQKGPGELGPYSPNASSIRGVEYYLAGGYGPGKPWSTENNGGKNLHNNDAPCAVCLTPDRDSAVMIPGRMDCGSSELRLEYSGYVATEQWNNPSKTDYICVDQTPETIPGGAQSDEARSNFMPVEVMCHPLQCPPYEQYQELTCAVCTV